MKKLVEDLKSGDFKQAYLLYGEEAYLKRTYKNKLKEALLAGADAMNFAAYEGKDIAVGEVIDLAETMPFFAERRVILIENSGFFKNACDELAAYLKEPAQTAYFIFVENEVDKRGKMYKAVKALSGDVEFKKQDERSLMTWILSILKKEGKKITDASMRLFLQKTGDDMENISKELEKLICYVGEREAIMPEDVEAICTTQITNQIFDMINAISEKKQKKALELYYDLLALKEPPMRILFLITRQFNLLYQTKDMMEQGFDKNAIGKQLGLPPFIAGQYMSRSKSFSKAILRNALHDCAGAEEDVKTGRLNDRMSVEILIVKYSNAHD